MADLVLGAESHLRMSDLLEEVAFLSNALDRKDRAAVWGIVATLRNSLSALVEGLMTDEEYSHIWAGFKDADRGD